MRKGRVVAMLAAGTAAVAGALHLRKKRSGGADTTESATMAKTNSSKGTSAAKKYPATA
jgi:hypothetical protein